NLSKQMSHWLAGDQERTAEVNTRVKKFLQALYWGDVDQAAGFVTAESRPQYRDVFSEIVNKERLVKSEIRSVELGPDSETATVTVVVQYYRIPNYVVKTRRETQTWAYNEGLWFFQDADVVDAS
ncbi:MAG: hypothetical protein KDD44_05255, partial [Bdellovibrionales bacterium]|nr:hypothetical protein [Bdellovibrionales bacterium]